MSAPPNEDFGHQPEVAAHGKKKKRGYAAGAFDVGSGANAAVGGQMQGGAPPPGMPQQPQAAPGYGGYPQQEPQQPAAAQGYQYPAQGYPAQQPQQPAYGGYAAPDQGYPAPQTGAPGVGGITQGMGGMNIGGQPQQQAQQQAQTPRAAMNQLYPTDLINQPFNASELDLPPPPITLPPNVSSVSVLGGVLSANKASLVERHSLR